MYPKKKLADDAIYLERVLCKEAGGGGKIRLLPLSEVLIELILMPMVMKYFRLLFLQIEKNN